MFGGCGVAVYGVGYWSSQFKPHSIAPESHTRYRVQRLIRLGEWLVSNQSALITAFDAIDDAHDMLIDHEMSAGELVDCVGFKQMEPIKSMSRMFSELRHDIPTRNVCRGSDVTLHHPFGAPGKEYEVVIEAPKPKDIPSQEEFDKVRSEVDITN